jgi:heat shock protein HslJ
MRHRGSLRAAGAVAAALTLVAMLLLGGCAGDGSSMMSTHAVPLRGTHWNLVDVGDTRVPDGSSGAQAPFMRLDPDKQQVNGYSALNNFFGGFESSGASLRFGNLASTRRAGPPAAMALESDYLKALGATATYRISGDTLEIFDAGGKRLARFVARPAN